VNWAGSFGNAADFANSEGVKYALYSVRFRYLCLVLGYE
ncbi:MAG: hypothetical protein ACI84K_001881, partial [Pseudohongiellaceae bacterium]